MKKLILLIICSLFFYACTVVDESVEVDENIDKEIEKIKVETTLEGYTKLLLDNIILGGPLPDQVPPIDNPKFVSIEEADKWLDDEDIVFILELNSKVYIFPQRIMVWHEVVNMTSSTTNCSFTYCPLTASAIAYFYPEGDGISFGTSGNLINSNLVMYERKSGTLIAQIDGVGLDNSLYGVKLFNKPSFWSKWKNAKASFEDLEVLSIDTGVLRDYDRDPYGDYKDVGGDNYYFNDSLISEAIYSDQNAIFPPKESIIALKIYGKKYAIDKSLVEAKGLVIFENLNLFAIYDKSIESIRLYIKPDGGEISYKDGVIKSTSGMSWSTNGKYIDGFDDLLSPNYYEVMWFAWYGFYPDTEVIK